MNVKLMVDSYTKVGELLLKSQVTQKCIDREEVQVLDEQFFKIEETIVLSQSRIMKKNNKKRKSDAAYWNNRENNRHPCKILYCVAQDCNVIARTL